jgi:hypothetical protein
MFNIKKLFNKTPIIEFYCHPDVEHVIPEPRPASKHIPDWFKKIPTHIPNTRDTFGDPSMTAKKCMPMVDAMTMGYVIPLCGDLGVHVNNDVSEIQFTNPPLIKLGEFHAREQLGPKPPGPTAPPVKFINHWVVKTKPGWSTLFIPLINSSLENPHFTCLGGLVDTDRYPKEVNFPAIWHTAGFNGTLKAGTPLVLAIPVKRSTLNQRNVVRSMTDKEYAAVDLIRKKQGNRAHVYTDELREPRK